MKKYQVFYQATADDISKPCYLLNTLDDERGPENYAIFSVESEARDYCSQMRAEHPKIIYTINLIEEKDS